MKRATWILSCLVAAGCADRVDTPLPGTRPQAMAVGDFDEDGRDDLVVGDRGSSTRGIFLLESAGDGTFARRPVVVQLGAAPNGFATADFDEDGHLDFGVSYLFSDGSGEAAVYLGDGAGGFGPPTLFNTLETVRHVAAGDVDGDGHVDFVTAGRYEGAPSTLVVVHHGRGDGTFDPAPNVDPAMPDGFAGGVVRSLTLGQLDADPGLEIVVALSTSVGVFDGLADRILGTAALSPVPGASQLAAVLVGDLNGDPHRDVVAVDQGDRVWFLHQDRPSGAGPVFPARFITSVVVEGAPRSAAFAGVGLRGAPHLVTANFTGGTLALLPGRVVPSVDGTPNDGVYVPARPAYRPVGAGPVQVVTGDFFGDGRPAAATLNQEGESVSVLHAP